MGKGEGNAHGIILGLADFFEGKKLDFIHTGMRLGNAQKGQDIFPGIIQRWNVF